MTLALDHIAISAETLEAGADWVEMALGVPLAGGGKHEPVAGMVVGHGFERVDGFRRGIFRVRVVDVKASAIPQDRRRRSRK